MKPYARILTSIDFEFEKALADFRSDAIFHEKKIIYTDEEKKRIGYRWMNLVRPFRQLKSIIRSLTWRSFFLFGNRNVFAVKYAAIVTYYNMLYELRSSFGPHEEFIRQYLDDTFSENYSTIARYMYHMRFLSFLYYPREFFLLLQDDVDSELLPIFKRKEKASMDLEKRANLDFINVFYYFRYRISSLLSWISRHIGMFLSDIYFSRREHGMIEQKNIDILVEGMSPGDICITRRNWAATNMSIPGFWKHMSMYIGTGEYLKNNFPEFLSIVSKLESNTHYIIEAVGSGVQITPLDTLARHNDYIAVMRTRFSPGKIRRALKKAITGVNAGYDFSFNYYSDINHVCSALVTKAYLSESSVDEGLHIALTRIGTGITYPPNDIVKKLRRELHSENRELDFVGFIDFKEKQKQSFISTEHEFLKTGDRSRLSVFLS